MKQQIEERLQILVGMQLISANRAADLQMFDFGHEPVPFQTKNGRTLITGEYTIHLQCNWRIRGPQGIIVGRRDLFYPAGEDPYKDLENFDYDQKGALNRRSELVRALLNERKDNPLVIKTIQADDLGGFQIAFNDGYFLEVFPDQSFGEDWRFFRVHSEEPHFVVRDGTIDAST